MKVLIVTEEDAPGAGDVIRARTRVLQDYGLVVIVEADAATIDELRETPGVLLVADGPTEIPEHAGETARMAIEAWNVARQPKQRKWEGSPWDRGDDEG